MSRLLFLFLFLAASLLLFASSQECSENWQLELDDAKALWEASGVVSYEYQYDQICFCFPPGPYVIEVLDCTVENVTLLSDEYDPPPTDQVYTIEELFTQLQQILDSCSGSFPPYNYSVSYDRDYGYPSNVNIDPEQLAIDEEIIYTVSNFTVIKRNETGCGSSADTNAPTTSPIETNAPTTNSVDTNTPTSTSSPSTDVSNSDTSNCSQAWQQELDTARELWESNGFISYDYNFTRFCRCLPQTSGPFAIEVRNCTIDSVSLIADGMQNLSTTDQVPTIDDLFMELQQLLDGCPFSYDVSFDEEFGYPVEAYIDRDINVADEEVSFSVSSFLAKESTGTSCSSFELANNPNTSSSASARLYGATALLSTMVCILCFGGN
jgi:Family of unknown function (DUF6174)